MADTAAVPPVANGHSSKPANGSAGQQPLTHYHSMFSDLLSWKNPRDSAIAYASVVTTIVAARYLDIIRYAFKLSWMALAVTVTAEIAGKTVLGNGLATQFRPRKYYTVSRELVDALVGDLHDLINFFAIESQRILFAENITASVAAGIGAFITYYLVKVVPYWALAILGTTLAFFVPLVYAKNQELIDQHIKTASDAINAQTAQARAAAQKQADQLTAMGKQYAGDYTGKVQEMLRGNNIKVAPKASSFPSPPTEEPKAAEPVVPEKEPVAAM